MLVSPLKTHTHKMKLFLNLRKIQLKFKSITLEYFSIGLVGVSSSVVACVYLGKVKIPTLEFCEWEVSVQEGMNISEIDI